MDRRCLLSGHQAKADPLQSLDADRITCPACGTYVATREALSALNDPGGRYASRKYILAGLVRRSAEEGLTRTLTTEGIENLLASIIPPSVPQDLLDHLLLYFASRLDSFFARIELDPNVDYPIAFAKNPADLEYTLRYADESGYVAKAAHEIRLTPKGWQRVTELRASRADSNQAFVAMSFDPSLDAAWRDGLKPALNQTGYNPLRIDEKQFNGKIDDMIVAEIRRSGLLVADVTGHRQGVYFEAGFALGLGLTVIWTCRKDHIDKAHFDTRQYNHIVWEEAEDLKERLVNRIDANGPGKAST